MWFLLYRSSATNAETKEEVAIKRIANAFDNWVDAKRTLREIKLLTHMDHENVGESFLFVFSFFWLVEVLLIFSFNLGMSYSIFFPMCRLLKSRISYDHLIRKIFMTSILHMN